MPSQVRATPSARELDCKSEPQPLPSVFRHSVAGPRTRHDQQQMDRLLRPLCHIQFILFPRERVGLTNETLSDAPDGGSCTPIFFSMQSFP